MHGVLTTLFLLAALQPELTTQPDGPAAPEGPSAPGLTQPVAPEPMSPRTADEPPEPAMQIEPAQEPEVSQAQAPAEPTAPRPNGRHRETIGWILTSIGTALTISGIGVIAHDQISANRCYASQGTCDVEGFATPWIGFPLMAGGGVFAAAGFPLVLQGRRRQWESAHPDVRLPRVATGSAGWMITTIGILAAGGASVWIVVDDPTFLNGLTLGVSTLLIGTGVSLGITGRRRRLNREAGNLAIDLAAERTRVGWALIGLGGAALVSGAVILAVDPHRERGGWLGGSLMSAGVVEVATGSYFVASNRRRPNGSPRVAFMPTVLSRGGGLMVQGRF